MDLPMERLTEVLMARPTDVPMDIPTELQAQKT
jgi:hypothetical protein